MSNLYGRPPGGGSKKVVISLVVVVAVLVGLVLFLWLKPASNDTTAGQNATTSPPTQAGVSSPVSPTGTAAGGQVTGPTAGGPAPQWTIPVPGDGGPSTQSQGGVPRGYDASDSGARKAAVNAVVAARWMKFRVTDPANTLGVLAIPDEGADRDAVLRQLVPKQPINVGTGKKETEQSPPGGKALGAQLITRDDKTALVHVLWEEFGKPSGGKIPVTVELVEVRLQWMQDDWLVSYLDKTMLYPGDPTKNVGGLLGQIDEPVPVPGEGWYW